MKRSTLLHLRFPFSFFLLPVFLFSSAVVYNPDWGNFWLVFFILHFLIYPASNGYNSFFDNDKKSIGGLTNPTAPEIELYWVSLMMDSIALLLALVISSQFTLMCLLYGIASKAYSHPRVRLKKYPLLGLGTVAFFQGYFTFLTVYVGIAVDGWATVLAPDIQLPAILSSLLLFGSYPMTQVYQHEEDGARNDNTISRKLGVLGTFHFTGIMFTVAVAGFVFYFVNYDAPWGAYLFLISLAPVLIYFTNWYLKVRRDLEAADYSRTMGLNLISSTLLNLFFLVWWIS